ncbi:hypothetical protein LT330_009327 [Penicillium expansum]|nr:hypothetical protein LT330_009327 [Penicillium expansum]
MASSSHRDTTRSKPHNKDRGKESKRPPSCEPWNLLPCQREDAVFKKWTLVRDEILRRIDLTHVDRIGCYRVGSSYSARRTCPTILVSGDHSKRPKTIEKSTKIINEILGNHNLSDVDIDFVECKTSGWANDAADRETGVLDRRVLQSPSMPGQSLSLEENSESAGTLGGFFELKLPGSKKPKVVAVTCFHVLNPTETSKTVVTKDTIRRWRKDGIDPNDKTTSDLIVHHPGPRAIREKSRSLEKEIVDIQSPTYKLWNELVTNGQDLRKGSKMMYLEAKERLTDCEAFLQDLKDFDPGFGKVWAASGFRTRQAPSTQRGQHKKPTNCDWALVEVPDGRLSANTTPEGHVLKQSPLPAKLDNLRLCLSGQKSRYSEGDYYSLQEAKVKHAIENGKEISIPTIEHTVIPTGNQFNFFAKPGDSGSLVYTKGSHVVVGLLFAGHVRYPRTSNFTHIDDLIADIKHITGATEVRLR